MSTYILTWNPKASPWHPRSRQINRTSKGHRVRDDWSTGNRTKDITSGDRFFLLKQGVEPRGFVASGWFAERGGELLFRAQHWSLEPGREANYANVEFDVVLADVEMLPLHTVEARVPERDWNRDFVASGVVLPAPGDGKLEKLWAKHLAKVRP